MDQDTLWRDHADTKSLDVRSFTRNGRWSFDTLFMGIRRAREVNGELDLMAYCF